MPTGGAQELDHDVLLLKYNEKTNTIAAASPVCVRVCAPKAYEGIRQVGVRECRVLGHQVCPETLGTFNTCGPQHTLSRTSALFRVSYAVEYEHGLAA